MKKSFPLTTALALVVGGAFLGHLATSNSSAQAPGKPKESTALALDLTAEASETMGYLSALRAGKIEEAIDLMEVHLDRHIVKLGESLAAMPASERSPQSLKVIKEFRDYRVKHPHPSSVPYIYNGITNAYKLLDSAK